MRTLAMMVHNHRRPASHGRFSFGARVGLAVMVAWLGAIVVPATAEGVVPSRPAAVASLIREGSLLCRPEPPDYPGCSPAQVRPLLRARFAREYTGHATGYRYHRMGQHHRGVIFAHLRHALNVKLARLYHTAVERYALQHTTSTVDAEGVTHVVIDYPRYRTWAGFKTNTTSFCNGTNLTVHFPTQYCWSITKLGQAGGVINWLLASTRRIAFSCNGFAIGGWASGTFAAWKMGTGVLAGGYYGAVGVEIGCQTTNLWNWVSSLW